MSRPPPPWRRPAANRLRAGWQRHLAWPGALALALLLAAALLALAVRPALQARESAALRDHVQRLDRLAARAAPAAERDPRDAWRDQLPAARERGRVVSALMQQLVASRLAVQGAEYQSEDVEPGLERLHVTVPLQGDWAPARALLGRLLNGFPNVALDGLQVEPAPEGTAGLALRLRLSLFFRRGAA